MLLCSQPISPLWCHHLQRPRIASPRCSRALNWRSRSGAPAVMLPISPSAPLAHPNGTSAVVPPNAVTPIYTRPHIAAPAGAPTVLSPNGVAPIAPHWHSRGALAHCAPNWRPRCGAPSGWPRYALQCPQLKSSCQPFLVSYAP